MQPKRKEKTFTEKVLSIVRGIPAGRVLTYKEVAKQAGNHNAARAIGNILKKNFDPKIPCHRVVPTPKKGMEGKPLTIKNVGEYNRGVSKKIRKLKAEGSIK